MVKLSGASRVAGHVAGTLAVNYSLGKKWLTAEKRVGGQLGGTQGKKVGGHMAGNLAVNFPLAK